MIYGYCRVSRPQQSIERQIRNIKAEYPSAVIVQEAYTGTTLERKQWIKLYKKAKSGDMIVFDSVSRMSRNAEEGFQAYQELYNRGVSLTFLKEPQISTATYNKALNIDFTKTGDKVDYILDGVKKYLMALAEEQIRLAFEQAEKEVTDLHQRTKEGIETARLNGKQIGRKEGTKIETKKAKEVKKCIFKYSKDFNGYLKDTEIISMIKGSGMNISRPSYYKYKAELKEELNNE